MNSETISILIYVGIGILALFILLYGIGFTSIGTDEVGIVEKWWSLKGSVPADGLIALKGEAGYQPHVLRAGVHFKTPFKYKVKKVRLVTIPQGQIGYVFARSGESLADGQTLGKVIPECKSFQDVVAFLNNRGQKGPQRQILREGTYAFNLAQFIIITKDKVHSIFTSKDESEQIETMRSDLLRVNGFLPVVISSSKNLEQDEYGNNIKTKDTIGIVTVNEGPTPDNGAIIAPIVGDGITNEYYHSNFQEPEKFLAAGGRKGKQMQVLTDGVYFINRLFANVDIVPKSIIDIGYVGVVVSYFGEKGEDVSGSDYSHGELVEQGKKGIWRECMMPGKYPFNTYAGKIIPVPTTNVILKWISGQVGDHKLDDNLKEINLITKDAFEPNLPLTVVFNIDYRKASSVIQRFGDIKLLIEQSLDPMVAGYFKNIGQTKTLIELVQDRSAIQEQASKEMKEKFKLYDLELQEVLIGTPAASSTDKRIDLILAQLRDRQVALEEIKTNEAKQKSAEKQRELNEAIAKSAAQAALTQSSIDIEVADNKGKSELKLAEQLALKTQKLAEADKYKRTQEADALRYTKEAEAAANAKATELNAAANAKQVELQAGAEAFKLEKVGAAQALNIKAVAEATAEQETKVGLAKGTAAKALVDAYGGPELQVQQSVLTAFAEALKISKSPLVPQTVIMGGADGKTPNAMEGILSMILANMASANGSIVNTVTPAHSDITNQSDNSSTKESKIAKKKDSISAKEPEV
ncbi:SPFH domain-containing protein [Clostridium beijerinckii]|uniref:SPFH domain-containing protein n=1 Tax=Clostridium beijerinckii TaxID=1520 RepID=UPI00098BE8BC|nr:SPFH domain-containing protein [Clostridium beijerinckii]MBA8934674.1 putative membrane protein YqiK [Clostridium beijerinckii]NOW04293.1 putative membrane protein YqiK [Clostridium beijerinckii]NRT71924.1 putative membrane protein YqiK [Clostridium beijerinckii]NRU39074.1 putative membrane protein YqiK [Clostridium beijerinckii]NSA97647.1 putative membrane protein YqiK [Clostridium beijerinckii]